MLKISILGAGSFGCAFASIYDRIGYDVTLWSYSSSEVNEIIKNHGNQHCLPGVYLQKIKVTYNIIDIIGSEIIFIAVPSFAVKNILESLKGMIDPSTIIVCLSKGLEENSLMLFSDLIKEILPNNSYAILSGPSHAEEIAKDVITAIVVSSNDNRISKYIQDKFSVSNIRIYINNDLIGVQIGAAFKNIIALAVGICDGMNLGDNTKAALMTRGLEEISRLGVAMGAQKSTFLGLSGIGDLIVTCISFHSRNKRAGILIGRGNDIKTAIDQINMTVEGYNSTKIAYQLGLKYNIELPIINEMYNILYKDKDPKIVLKDLFNRSYKFEIQ